MKNRDVGRVVLCLLIGLLTCGCASKSQDAPSQSQQDQKMRERVANATQKVKERSDQAAQKVDAASQKLEHKAEVAAQGIKEGWNRDNSKTIDINSASKKDLEDLGLSHDEAGRIIDGRPFKSKRELVTRGVLSERVYRRIEGQITAD